MRPVGVMIDPPRGRHQPRSVGKALLFGDEGDHVLAEAVHTHIQPEAHDLFDFFPDPRVVHVQVRLLYGEQMEIVFAALVVELPGLPLNHAVPVVGEGAVLFGLPPDIVVRIGLLPPAAGLEPGVFVAGVVHHQVHDDPDPALVGAVEDLFESAHASVFPGDVHIVHHVVAVVRVGRGVERRKPYGVHMQRLDVVELFVHAHQVAHAVSVAVAEAARPYLIEYRIPVPESAFHTMSPQRRSSMCSIKQGACERTISSPASVRTVPFSRPYSRWRRRSAAR